MRNIIRLLSVFLSFYCIISVFYSADTVFADAENLKEINLSQTASPVSISKNGTYISFDTSDTSVSFISDDFCISSIPGGELTGLNRINAISMLSATVIKESGETEKLYSYSNATYKLFSSKDKIRVLFDFSDYQIKIPLDFYLIDDKSFNVSVPVYEIVDSNNTLLDISFLPYLGSASIESKGYMLIPDGSGAGIYFGSKNSAGGVCKYGIYGMDAMNQKDYVEIDSNYANIPMYAFMYENEISAAFVPYINKGASQASLNVSVGDDDCPFSTAYFSFNYRPYTLTTLLDRTSKAQKFYIASKKATTCKEFEVTYRYFKNRDATLLGVSGYIGEKIFGSRKTKISSEMTAFLDVYLSVYKRVYTFGIPHNSNVALTSLNDCNKIAKDFDNPVMMLRGLDKYGAVSGPVDNKFSISKNVGKMSEYSKLNHNAQVYNVCEFVRFDKSSFGFSKMFNAARNVTGKSIYTYFYNPATLLSELHKFNILEPNKINGAVSKYVRSAVKKGVNGISPVTLGNSPYTNGNKSDRQKTTDIFTKSLKLIKENNLPILLENPDAYSLIYADKVISLPTTSSGQDLIDFDIPFIQMVVRNYLDYSGEPVNISGDTAENSILNSAKTGSFPCFAITNKSYNQIKDTELDYLYGTDYNISGNTMKKVYNEYKEKMLPTVGKQIIDFCQITPGVSVTVFSDDVRVYVNSKDTEYVLENGKTLNAGDYFVEVS